jgi:hypothetical protein
MFSFALVLLLPERQDGENCEPAEKETLLDVAKCCKKAISRFFCNVQRPLHGSGSSSMG